MIRALTVSLACVLSTQAFALDDCNKLSATKQLEDRLQCLQKNNAELLAAIQGIKAIGENQEVVIQTGEFCLNNDHGSPNHLTKCAGGVPAKFKLHQ